MYHKVARFYRKSSLKSGMRKLSSGKTATSALAVSHTKYNTQLIQGYCTKAIIQK
jgi:hypothetical protein